LKNSRHKRTSESERLNETRRRVMTTGHAHETLTEYELQRLAHVRRNQEYMARLGVTKLAQDVMTASTSKTTSTTTSRRKKPREATAPTRRSSRVLGAKPTHDGSVIDALEEDEDAGTKRRRKTPKANGEDMDDEEIDAFATSREWLAEAREKLLATRATSAEGPKGKADDAWRRDAVARWGKDVPAADAVKDWKAWTMSRLGTPPPPSKLQLLQEYYAHDAWMLLIACALMSRVASGALKHECIANFFEQFPTPSAALEARAEDVFEIIKRLGLFPGRMRTIVEVSTRFLMDTGEFEVGLEPERKIYGIGEFGVDSFEIFARGDVRRKPKDCNLQAFCAWQKRHGNVANEDDKENVKIKIEN
jgi:methyl-CpG-binding domain protein 4